MTFDDFIKKYTIDGRFGDKRTYGLHSGEDWNGIEGGNTDCGYKLFPIKEGEVVHTSNSNSGYGNIIIYRIEGAWGERWIRYSHCKEIIAKSGRVSKETPIALLGTSGNSTACHLHWDIIKKPMRNWRTYAKNESTLKEYFEEPTAFFNRWKDAEDEDNMPAYFKPLLNEYQLNLENEGQIRAFFDKGRKYDEEIDNLKEQIKSVNESLADRARQVSLLTEANQKLNNRVDELTELYNKTRSEFSEASWRAEKLEIENQRLEEENQAFKEKNDLMAYGWFTRLVSLFGR